MGRFARFAGWLQLSSQGATAVAACCLYAFLSACKPSENYLTQFLERVKGLTQDQTYNQVYPVYTYASLVTALVAPLMFVGLPGRQKSTSAGTADDEAEAGTGSGMAGTLFRRARLYKFGVLVEAFAFLGTRVLLLWGHSLAAMQWTQVLYAVAIALQMALFSFAWGVVEAHASTGDRTSSMSNSNEQLQRTTSAVKAANIVGKIVSAMIAQIDVVLHPPVGHLYGLTMASFFFVVASCLVACLLPTPHPKAVIVAVGMAHGSADADAHRPSQSRALWQSVRNFYGDKESLVWSLVVALSTTALFQVENYVQNVWVSDAPVSGGGSASVGVSRWNGAVGVVAMFAAMVGAVLPAKPGLRRVGLGRLTLPVELPASLGVVGLVLCLGWLHSLWAAYLAYVALQLCSLLVITIATARVGALTRQHGSGRYALIGAINAIITFTAASALQGVATLLDADDWQMMTLSSIPAAAVALLLWVARSCSSRDAATPSDGGYSSLPDSSDDMHGESGHPSESGTA